MNNYYIHMEKNTADIKFNLNKRHQHGSQKVSIPNGDIFLSEASMG